MATVYIVATVLSSVSLLLCNHHHAHSTHIEHHDCSCSCEGVTITADCCNHHHPVLGDNHTDYIASSQRNDSRASLTAMLLLAPAVMTSIDELSCPERIVPTIEYGTVAEPLRAAFTSSKGLRAPPVLV